MGAQTQTKVLEMETLRWRRRKFPPAHCLDGPEFGIGRWHVRFDRVTGTYSFVSLFVE